MRRSWRVRFSAQIRSGRLELEIEIEPPPGRRLIERRGSKHCYSLARNLEWTPPAEQAGGGSLRKGFTSTQNRVHVLFWRGNDIRDPAARLGRPGLLHAA
jgi:hypothetical protein